MQTIGATTWTMTYDRNRLVKTGSGATTPNQRYDAFGRSTTDAGTQLVEQNAYNGYDQLVRQQMFDPVGTAVRSLLDPHEQVDLQGQGGQQGRQENQLEGGGGDIIGVAGAGRSEHPNTEGVASYAAFQMVKQMFRCPTG